MDTGDWMSIVSGARNIYELIGGIFDRARNEPDNGLTDSMKESLLGSRSGAIDASAKLAQMLNKTAVPFLLRMGQDFRLPPDVEKIEEIVLEKDVWDWTYVFGLRGDMTPIRTVNYLRQLYCDPEDNRLVRPEAKTTCLFLSEHQLPKAEFGESFYIAGVALTSSKFDHIYNIPIEDLLPNVVIRVDESITAVSDVFAMNFMLQKTREFIFHASANRDFLDGFLYDDPPKEEHRKLSLKMLSALNIGE